MEGLGWLLYGQRSVVFELTKADFGMEMVKLKVKN